MTNEVTHLNLAGRMLHFVNSEGLYPVNQYQSLLLATASELAALLVAVRQGCPLSQLAAWETCCGGGPAAVTLKSLGLNFVQATDLNEDAVAACGANAARNGLTIDRLVTADLLVDGGDRLFDIIACNPPCGIGLNPNLRTQLTDAMRLAVQGGVDGMDLTHALLTQAEARLAPGGSLVFVAVSTGNVRRLKSWLDEMYPRRWRTFPSTPVAAPYMQIDAPDASRLIDPAREYEPLVWKRPDGWFWRLSWIVEVVNGEHFLTADDNPPVSGFALSPYGQQVNSDPALAAMIENFSRDGTWLS